MTVIQDVDIRLMIGRITPTSDYLWVGNSNTGLTLAEAIGEWRDLLTSMPTEAALIAEWDAYLAEQAALDAAEAATEADLADVRAAQIQAALDTIQADLTTLGASPTNAQVLQILARCLQRQSRIIRALRHIV